MRDGEADSNPMFENYTDDAIAFFRGWLQRFLQSFALTIHAKPSRLSAGNDPLGRWAGLCAESRSTGTEEKGQSPQRPPAVDTPLAVDCGSCVVPFLAGYPPSFPNHPSRAKSHYEHATIHTAPLKAHSFVAGYAAWGILHSVVAKPPYESGTIDWCATDID